VLSVVCCSFVSMMLLRLLFCCFASLSMRSKSFDEMYIEVRDLLCMLLIICYSNLTLFVQI